MFFCRFVRVVMIRFTCSERFTLSRPRGLAAVEEAERQFVVVDGLSILGVDKPPQQFQWVRLGVAFPRSCLAFSCACFALAFLGLSFARLALHPSPCFFSDFEITDCEIWPADAVQPRDRIHPPVSSTHGPSNFPEFWWLPVGMAKDLPGPARESGPHGRTQARRFPNETSVAAVTRGQHTSASARRRLSDRRLSIRSDSRKQARAKPSGRAHRGARRRRNVSEAIGPAAESMEAVCT